MWTFSFGVVLATRADIADFDENSDDGIRHRAVHYGTAANDQTAPSTPKQVTLDRHRGYWLFEITIRLTEAQLPAYCEHGHLWREPEPRE